MIYFTADSHLSHTNIIKHCTRPFTTIEEMDDTIIDNINSVVTRNDHLFHLGDFVWGNYTLINKLRKRIKCKITLILGNHDKLIRKNASLKSLFETVDDIHILRVNNLQFILFHYCMRVWPQRHYGAIHLFGHSHGTLVMPKGEKCMDVGVDTNNFKPYSLDEIVEVFTKN